VKLEPSIFASPRAPDLVVLIPTAGRAPLLRRTLESIEACVKPLSYRQTLIVENGPAGDAAEAIMRDFAATLRARWIHVRQPGKSNALNHAIAQMEGGELVVFFDDDVRVEPSALTAYADAAACESGGQFFGGPFGVDYEQAPPPWLQRVLPRSARGWERAPQLPPGKEPFLGFNWAAFASDIRATGGFNPHRGPGAASGLTVGDESILQRAMIARGMRETYVPAARVWHYVPAERCTPQWLLDRTFRHGLAKGMQRGGERPALFGRPLWVYQRRAQGHIKGIVEWLTFREDLRFRWRHRSAFNRGLWLGAARRATGMTEGLA
jgi:hypothetical protein